MSDSIVVARPDRADQLVLLFHGVGAMAAGLAPIGEAIAGEFSNAFVVSVASPFPSDLGQGRQWFSVRGITEENRVQRIAEVMPLFLKTVRGWQSEAAIGIAGTTLLGFSQGAIMALESTQQAVPVSAHVVAIAGRFASGPRVAPQSSRLHLLHGEADSVMPIALSIQAVETLRSLGARATLDRFPGLGHSIDARVVKRVIERIIERVGT